MPKYRTSSADFKAPHTTCNEQVTISIGWAKLRESLLEFSSRNIFRLTFGPSIPTRLSFVGSKSSMLASKLQKHPKDFPLLSFAEILLLGNEFEHCHPE